MSGTDRALRRRELVREEARLKELEAQCDRLRLRIGELRNEVRPKKDLRLRGADVLTAYEDGSAELEDPPLLHRTTELGRVLFTQDTDLLAVANLHKTTDLLPVGSRRCREARSIRKRENGVWVSFFSFHGGGRIALPNSSPFFRGRRWDTTSSLRRSWRSSLGTSWSYSFLRSPSAGEHS